MFWVVRFFEQDKKEKIHWHDTYAFASMAAGMIKIDLDRSFKRNSGALLNTGVISLMGGIARAIRFFGNAGTPSNLNAKCALRQWRFSLSGQLAL